MKNVKVVFGLFAALIFVTLTGCPDYSNQRPVPDYENMTDSAGGGASSEDDKSEDEVVDE